ncbi:MAG: histidine phosphatase family protein [Candidatus Berkelbacteria bacterium]|nr:histidine phosphatase family protein [Candidatus Berkelbacteria bacterium]
MKKLVIVRHGDYCYSDGENVLSHAGEDQIRELIEKLVAENVIINSGGELVILSSTARRAVDSAKIIAEALGVRCNFNEILWSESFRIENLPGALELVRQLESADTVIMVTHYKYTKYFPQYFGQEYLGVNSFPMSVAGKGRAWVIDCETKTCEYF